MQICNYVATYGVPFVQNSKFYELALNCWYLQNLTGNYKVLYWYLCSMVVFHFHTGIYT